MLTYLATEQPPPGLRGMVYVHGSVTIPAGVRIAIDNGALVAESTAHLSPPADLAITHSPSTRTLPGLIVLDHGKLTVAQHARLRVHGLVYGNRTISAGEGAALDVVGAVFGNDPGLSFLTTGAIVMIRYDPAVLGTPRLLFAETDLAVAWIASWEEVP